MMKLNVLHNLQTNFKQQRNVNASLTADSVVRVGYTVNEILRERCEIVLWRRNGERMFTGSSRCCLLWQTGYIYENQFIVIYNRKKNWSSFAKY